MLGELTKNEMNNLLSSQVVGRIACCVDNAPYIVPVTYTFDGDYIYGQTLEGKKLEILRNNTQVCFEVDTMTDMRNWKSVIVYGRFEELIGEEEESARKVLFDRVLTLMTSSTIHPHEHQVSTEVEDTNRVKPVMYRIHISEMTGRFERS